MKKIPDKFTKYGYDFKLLKRTNDIVMYEQSQKVSPNSRVIQYEVHIVRVQKERVFNDTFFEECEKLASASEFGLYGWSYAKYENAINKFNELVKNEMGVSKLDTSILQS